MSNMNEITVSVKRIPRYVIHAMKCGVMPVLAGPPGVGKSSVLQQIADHLHLEYVDHRLPTMDPTDFTGVMAVDQEKQRAKYYGLDEFPIEGDPLPKGKKGWLVCIDELADGNNTLQSASNKLFLDRKVNNKKLHDKCYLVAATNRREDRAAAGRVNNALRSRVLWIKTAINNEDFQDYGATYDIDHRVLSFLRFKPAALHVFDPTNEAEYTFPCPRTWEFVSKLIKPLEKIERDDLPFLSGCLGEGMAREFFSYTQIYKDIPEIGDIMRNPDGIRIGTEPSIQYALAGMVGHHMTKDNADTLMAFVERLMVDFQVNILRMALAKDPEIKKTISVRNWIQKNARELAARNR